MARFIKNRDNIKGQVPGSLILVGKQKMEQPIIQLMTYDEENLLEKELSSIREINDHLEHKGVKWMNIYGIHDKDLISDLGTHFSIHSLHLEDILNTDHRPKFEDHEDYNVFILKMLQFREDKLKIVSEQISIIIHGSAVITLQEQKGDVFNPVRERIRKSKGRIRQMDSDYLVYAILDTIVDNYTILIEKIGVKIEDLEERIFSQKGTTIVEDLYAYKTEINYLRKSVRPVKEIISQLMKSESNLFTNNTLEFFRDLNDHITQASETIELYNSMISDQLNAFNSNVSNRMNEVMKVLTIFASIFIPLTFLAGIYGMNFDYIPELKFRYSYLIFWMVILALGLGLMRFFKKKKWL